MHAFKWFFLLGLLSLSLLNPLSAAEPTPGELVAKAKRILFLGDSITASGVYVAMVDAWLQTRPGTHVPQVIDCGLSSETVSGLSEEGHAGGKFPRPDLHERLDRVLALVKPDLVFACYGINCGIYEPFDPGRFAKYQEGMQKLKAKVEAAGAQLILITPPTFDDQRAKKPFSYNGVLDQYADWLLQQRAKGWQVIDLHHPMTKALAERRAKDEKFTFQPDAVHPNDAGHWFMASQIIRALGDEAAANAESPQAMLQAAGCSPELFKLVQQRVNVLKDAYVAAAGHKRPGVGKGLPVEEAEAKAAELTAKIQAAKK